MNANHRRFEHSIGVAHLAERMATRLAKTQPNLGITEKDILCVKLAGLCHDLGHGPYSHVYDKTFPERLKTHLARNPELMGCYEGIQEKPENWTHEDGSCMMIDAMLAELGLAIDMDKLDEPLKQIGDGIANTSFRVYDAYDMGCVGNDDRKKPNLAVILTSRDWIFVKEMIIGEPVGQVKLRESWSNDESGYVGRPHRHQEYFYDIVANRHSGLDVDKIDYFARDARRAFRGSGEIHFRLIEEAIVAWGECPRPDKCFYCKGGMPQQHLMICYPEKCGEMCVDFFHHRFKLHSTVYTHKTTQASTLMIADVMTLADPYFRLLPDRIGRTGKGHGLPLSRAMLDPKVYLRMRDCVIDLIEFSEDPRLARAQDVIRRLRSRDLYKCAAVRKLDMENDVDKKIWAKKEIEIEAELLQVRGEYEGHLTLNANDIIIEKRNIHSGAKEDNPLLRMRFLPKRNIRLLTRPIAQLPEAFERAEKNYVAHTPIANQENSIRAFCRGSKEKCELLGQVFAQWEEQCDTQYSGEFQTTFDEILEDDMPTEIPDAEDPLTQPQEEAYSPEYVSPIPVHQNNNQNGPRTGNARRTLDETYN